MAMIYRKFEAECELSTSQLTVLGAPPAYEGEHAAMTVQIALKNNGADYTPSGVKAEMYLFDRYTYGMSRPQEMTVSGSVLSANVPEEFSVFTGVPDLVIRLTEAATGRVLVACATPIRILRTRGKLMLSAGNAAPSEVVYVGKSPYIDTATTHWMVWDHDAGKYVDSGVSADSSQEGVFLPIGAEAADSAKLGGKPALWYTHPTNLLDNSDFRRPINQRGKTNYTTAGADTIDRWNISANTESLNVNSGGVTLTAKADGYAFLRQSLDRQRVAGKTVTFAACTSSGVIAAVSAALPAAAPDSDVTYAGANVGGMDVYIGSNASEITVQIRTALGGAIGLAWAALYEGAYTAATLPPYAPKDEAVELAACRRRYQRIGAAGFAATFGFGIIQSIADNLLRVFVPLPQALRTNPTATFTGTMTIMGYSPSGQATTTAVSITAAYATSTGVEIVMVPAAAIVSGSMYIVRMNSGSYLELTA